MIMLFAAFTRELCRKKIYHKHCGWRLADLTQVITQCHVFISLSLCFTQGLSISTIDLTTGVLTPGQTASISLPQQIISLIPMGSDDIILAFTVFTEADLFPVRDKTLVNVRTAVGSSVISAIVDGVQDGTQLPAPVEVLLLLSDVGPNETASSRTCVFWDFSAAGI